MNEPSTSTDLVPYDLAGSFQDALTLQDEQDRADLCVEGERLKTFTNWNVAFINKRDLAMLGFYFLKAPDAVKCAFCGVNICRWEPKHDILIEHFRLSNDCPLLNMTAVTNIPLDANELDRFLLSASYCPDKPQPDIASDDSCVYPLYKTKEERFRTFNNWPLSFPKTPQELSEAGFFYMGSEDEVSCFSCGGSIVSWKEDDVVLEVHASRFSNCKFVKSIAGEEFVQNAKAKYDKSSETVVNKSLFKQNEDESNAESRIVVPAKNNQEISSVDSMQEINEGTRDNSARVPRYNTPNVHFEFGTPLWNFKFHIGDK